MALTLAFVQGSSLQGDGKQSVKPRERKWIFAWEECKRKERVRYCCLREDTKRVCVRAKKEQAAQERKRRESNQEGAAQRKKKTAMRELCVGKKIKRREQSVAAFKRDNLCVCVCVCVCERVKKNKRDFSLVVRHTHELL